MSGLLKNNNMKKGKHGGAIAVYLFVALLIWYIIYTLNLTISLWNT